MCSLNRGYQAKRVFEVVLVASVADSFGPTICPSLPSFTPYFAFQCRPTSTPSSSLRTTLHSIRGRPSKYPCKPLLLVFQAPFKTEFVVASRHFFSRFQLLGTALSFRGVLPISRFQVCTRRSSICLRT